MLDQLTAEPAGLASRSGFDRLNALAPAARQRDRPMDAKTAQHQDRQAHRRRPELVVPDLRRERSGPTSSTSPSSTARPGCSPTIPASPRPASCESKITYIDGDEGILLYRGYPIEQLAEHGDFLETCYLLLYGELPTAAQKADFDKRVTHHTMVHEQMSRFFQGFRRDAHPMAVMVGSRRRAVGLLSRLHRHLRSASAHGRLDPHDREDADARRDGLQIFDRPAVRLSEERARLCRRTSCACASRCRARTTRSIRCWRAPWTASSSCTPTTSRTPRPRPCGSPARRAPIRSPASPPASPACGARRMAAPTRRR